MKTWLVLAAALALTSCSSDSTQPASKAPEKPLQPLTGQQALQTTYPVARHWAPDCQPLQIRSISLDQAGGKAGAWEVIYVSAQRASARTYTWSAVEGEGNLHQGVYPGSEEAWSGPSGQQRPFPPSMLKTDTPQALATAIANSAAYLKKPGTRPPVTFLLDFSPRFPGPAWRVLWGTSVASAEYTVFIDAFTGSFLRHVP